MAKDKLASLFLYLWAAVCLVFGFSRIVDVNPNRGDIAIWLSVHEWLARGEVLYETVWDHKDWGFFLLTHPFYRVLGTPGIYIAAFLAVLALSVGIYLIARPYQSRAGAVAIAGFGMVVYTAAPTFLSVYTENLAIGTFVLAVGLLRRYPALSGVVFAISVSVKISGITVWLLVLLALVVSSGAFYSRASRVPVLSKLVRNVAGFTGAFFLILVAAASAGSLLGWLEIIGYNRYYQQMRDFPPQSAFSELPFRLAYNAFLDAGRLVVGEFAFVSTLFAAAMILVALCWVTLRNPLSSHKLLEAPTVTSVSSAVVLGTLLTTLAQRPVSHHWQYLVGALSMSVTASAAVLLRHELHVASWKRVLVLACMIAPLFPAVVFNQEVTPRGIVSGLRGWPQVEEGASLGPTLAALPEGLKIAVLGGNAERIDFARLPPGSRLACRHFYHFSHILPRYEDEIGSCLGGRPDLVIVSEAGSWGTDAFRSEVRNRIPADHVPCPGSTDKFALWTIDLGNCPTPGGQIEING